MSTPLQAILFDLDDTLLDNNMEQFLPHYFQRLAAWVSHVMPPQEFIAHLMQATRAMMANDGRATNEEVFAAAFYPLAGRPREEMEPLFLQFYAQEFPQLREYTRRKPEARAVVQAAVERGYDLAVATNPLFPAAAIWQRLEWAGVADLPFRLVTTYENSRACKPSPIYFQQICADLGRPAEACLMVGDDPVDMAAARIGCPTFYIADAGKPLPPDVPAPSYRGTLADVAALLHDGP
jgi:HAD superfamily hydrolase (TIGR01549 family)